MRKQRIRETLTRCNHWCVGVHAGGMAAECGWDPHLLHLAHVEIALGEQRRGLRVLWLVVDHLVEVVNRLAPLLALHVRLRKPHPRRDIVGVGVQGLRGQRTCESVHRLLLKSQRARGRGRVP